jgi:ureidoacrylate peracid hydrolase
MRSPILPAAAGGSTLVKDAIGSFGHAEMDASLQFNMPAYANAIVSTDELIGTLSA